MGCLIHIAGLKFFPIRGLTRTPGKENTERPRWREAFKSPANGPSFNVWRLFVVFFTKVLDKCDFGEEVRIIKKAAKERLFLIKK